MRNDRSIFVRFLTSEIIEGTNLVAWYIFYIDFPIGFEFDQYTHDSRVTLQC